jgi:mannose-1-phosphate guanylyltransferase
MKKNTYVAIMAGGIGSRFWPMSREQKPKQFLDILDSGQTLIQSTYERFKQICPVKNIYILTNEKYRNLVKEQLEGISDEQILGEPMRKNTAPTIAYFSNKIFQLNPKANTIIAPSDHLIQNESRFLNIIHTALKFTKKNDGLITLGIKPSRPDTGYGYIQYIDNKENPEIYKVKTFTEKPTLKIAKTFLNSGDFVWNSGIFIWTAENILKAFKEYLPEVYDVFNEGKNYYNTKDETAFIHQAFAVCSNISIDYGVMEKAENVFVIPSSFGWSDLGTWASLYAIREKDYLGNVVSGNKVIIHDATDCMVKADDEKLIVLQGLKDFIVVDTQDVLLIFQKRKEQELKQIVSEVKRQKGDNYL